VVAVYVAIAIVVVCWLDGSHFDGSGGRRTDLRAFYLAPFSELRNITEITHCHCQWSLSNIKQHQTTSINAFNADTNNAFTAFPPRLTRNGCHQLHRSVARPAELDLFSCGYQNRIDFD
jgi:hypothetical protein